MSTQDMTVPDVTSAVPAISVIMPVYNRRDTVATAIQSVLAQTYTDFELIIVDDGSTDDSRQVIASFLSDPRVRYHHQDNSGRPSLARNTGIALAHGAWLAFLDSDDEWFADKLERQMALVREATDAGVELDLVVGDYEVITNGMRSSASFFADYQIWALLADAISHQMNSGYIYHRSPLVNALYRRGFAATQAVLVRASLVGRCGGFDADLVFSEDNDLWMKVAERGRCGCVLGCVHRYILHGNNITSEKKENFYTDTIRVLKNHERFAQGHGYRDDLLRERIAHYQIGLSGFYFRKGQGRLGWQALCAARRFWFKRQNIKSVIRNLFMAIT